MFDIKEELKKLPDSPGVYIMHDKADNIIYVGKAVNLKRRVSSYFQTRPRSPKIEKMISLIDHFEYIMVESEMEAFVLECNLIKENRPKYNTMLMDDKTYPFVKITLFEKYPRIYLTRHHQRDKAKYYGPYTNVTALKEILKMFRKIYGYRTCAKSIDGTKAERPCLYNQVGECPGPCSGKISEEEYKKNIEGIVRFFEGDVSSTVKDLKAKMLACSENMEFEQAAVYRDMLGNIEALTQVQRVTASDDLNRDVIGIAMKEYKAIAQVFFIRSGKMVGREHFLLEGESEDRSEALLEFVKQFYGGAAVIPKEILLSEDIEERELTEKWLSDLAGSRVHLVTPIKGKKEKLVELAVENANNLLNKDIDRLQREAERTTGAIEELGELLNIEAPLRIESYDISNTQGFESVGSMVVYENGKPKKSDYRRFRIKTVKGPDDYASMKEVLTRRFSHLDQNDASMADNVKRDDSVVEVGQQDGSTVGTNRQNGIEQRDSFTVENDQSYGFVAENDQSYGFVAENDQSYGFVAENDQSYSSVAENDQSYSSVAENDQGDGLADGSKRQDGIKDSFTKLPDLILMDGGRGQVNAALEIAEQFGLSIRICGMVKDDHHRTRGLYFENEELPIDTGSECFKLITRIQDETHRFAIEYHKSLRSKAQVRSVLDDIPGIGANRRRALITHFETITAIKEASIDELSKAPGMNKKAAQAVYDFFHTGV